MGYSRKKQTGDLGHGISWSIEEIAFGFSEGDQEKTMWNFQGQRSWLLTMEFPKCVTQFPGISKGEALFCPEFPRVKCFNF